MKTLVLTAAMFFISLCCNAQFKLTPTAGLITEDGPYTILRSGVEADNYEAAKKAIKATIPNAEIIDVEYEKSFSVIASCKQHGKLPGDLVASDWVIPYKLKIEASDDKIQISFEEIGTLERRSKRGEVFYIHPTTGKNSMLVDMTCNHYLFNSKGKVGKRAQRYVLFFEEFANGIVKEIENNLN